eukprot:6783526-Pyramimonas_sp.AAC.1
MGSQGLQLFEVFLEAPRGLSRSGPGLSFFERGSQRLPWWDSRSTQMFPRGFQGLSGALRGSQ